METLQTIARRCSVREFSEKPVPKDKIETIVDAGRQAPTARGLQPCEFIAVRDKKRLVQIAQATDHGKFIQQATCCIIVCCKDTKYYLEDGCAATENMLLAACDLGIASCWVAGDKKTYCEEIKNMLGIGKVYNLVSMIALGYPKDKCTPHKKKSLKEVLHWERF